MYPRQNRALWSGGVFAGVIASQLLSAALWNEQGGTHIVWFPGAVLLGALLSTRVALWPWLMLAALLGLTATGIAFGLPALDTAMVVFPVVALMPVAAWLLIHVPGTPPLLEDTGRLVVFAAVGVLALPAVCATLIDNLSRHTALHGSVLSDWPNIALAHALGYALYIPVWLSLRSPAAVVRHAGRIPFPFLAAMAGSIALLGIVWHAFGGTPALVPLLCLAPAPILIAACVRAQMTGSSIAVFLIVIVAAHLSVGGHGPFVAETPQRTTLSLQLWTLAVSLAALTVGAIVEKWHASRRALNRVRDDMRELAGHLIATQEQERARLARDLHDDINQRVAAMSIGLSALHRRLGGEEGDDAHRLQAQAMALSEELRRVSHQLHPDWLSHVGLRASLEALCELQPSTSGPQVSLVVDHAVAVLPVDIALCFYRVVQEALANALRHAEASRITIGIAISPDKATLRVSDDGKGFDTDAIRAQGPGIGLISMNERAKLLGGSFHLYSMPGKGVELCIRIPLVKH